MLKVTPNPPARSNAQIINQRAYDFGSETAPKNRARASVPLRESPPRQEKHHAQQC